MKFFIKINNTWETPDFNTNDETGIQLYWTFDNLQNPVDYVGEYSYEFTLPYTQHNNQIFHNFSRLDSVTSTTSTHVFHPNVLIPYIIQTTNDVISTGQAYLSEVNENGYVIALNGSLCTAFTKLLNSGWDTDKAANDDEYYLFDDIDEVLTANLVKTMWNNDDPAFTLDPTYSDISEVLTVVPMHQGRYQEFESTKNVRWYGFPINFYFESPIFVDGDGNEIDCGDGLNECQMQEYRAYEQNFAIYVQKLFAIYQRKCREICDYELNLDSRWYNDTYEYLQKMVYVLGRLKHKAPEIQDVYDDEQSISKYLPNYYGGGATTIPGLSNQVYNFNNFQTITVERGEMIEYNFEFHYNSTYPSDGSETYYLLANWSNPLVASITFTDQDNNVYKEFKYAFHELPDVLAGSDYYVDNTVIDTNLNGYERIIGRYTPSECGDGIVYGFSATVRLKSDFNGTLTPKVAINYCSDSIPYITYAYTHNLTQLLPYYCYPSLTNNPQITIKANATHTITPATRTGQTFNFMKVFGDINPFDVLLKYTKMLGMVWIVDDYNKVISIKRRSDYFWDLLNVDNNAKNPNNDIFKGFYDITELVDYDSYKITPLAWDTRRVHLNYDDCDDMYMKKYKEKYDRTYGSALIITENYLNKDEENLLCNDEYDTIAPSCVVSPYYIPYSYYQQQRQAKVRCIAEPTAQSDSGEQADVNNNFYFRLSNTTLPANMHTDGYRKDDTGTYAYITDDSEYEYLTGTYMWHANSYMYHPDCTDELVRTIPNYSTIRNGYSLQFSAPYEVYFTVPTTIRPLPWFDPIPLPAIPVKYLYEQEYQKYVEEVYNVNNKTLEVNCAVNGELYRRLKNVPLVLIEDVAYLVTEIEGWNEFNRTTKLKLRQIWNYNKLTQQNQSGGYTPVPSWNTIDGTEPLPVPSDVPVDIEEITDIAYELEEGKTDDEIIAVFPTQQ